MKNDQQKKKSTSKSKKQNKYRALSLVMTSSLIIAPLTVPLSFYLPGGITASAAVLDAEILSNISSSNNSGTSTANPWTADGSSQNVDFSISGGELVGGSVITNGTKQAVLAIPNELQGRVSPNGAAQIDTNVTITVGDLTFLTGTLNAINQLTNLLTDITDGTLGSLTGVTLNLTTVNQKIDALNNLENFGSASFSSNAVLSPDGSYIHANIDDGLGLVLAQNVSSLLQDLKAAVDALNATGSGIASNVVAAGINAALLPVKGTVDTAINAALPLVAIGGSGVNELADASVLGGTTINIPTTVLSPQNLTQDLDAKFVGTVIKADAIDVSLIKTANGVSDIYYAGTAAAVAPPVVTNTTGTSTTGYTVTGTATAGNSIAIRNAGGTTIGTGLVDGSGNFTVTIPQGAATANESLNAIAIDGTDESTPTAFTTPADAVVVAPPVVTSTTGTSLTGYTVKGTATAGNTVDIRNGSGNTIASGVADANGDFTITLPSGQATADESLTAVAKDGTNESTPTPFKTPLDVALVVPPVVTSTTGTSATGYTVKGTATAGNTVDIRNIGGTTIGTATADSNGDFTITIPQGEASANEALTAVAKDGANESLPTPFTTPVDAVVVAPPVVTSTTGTSATGYTVNGTATAGNTVDIRNLGGTTIGTATVDANGDFTITIAQGDATALEPLTAIAKDGTNESLPTAFTTPADTVVVAPPVVTSTTGNSTLGYTVKGTATAGDTVDIRNLGGTTIGTATADGNGDFTVTIPQGQAMALEPLTAVAKNGANESLPVSFITPADPIVVVAPPVVTDTTGTAATGYTVKGTAEAGATIEIHNIGGTTIGSGIADGNGDFTVTIPQGQATANEALTAVAIVGTDESLPTAFVTPADPVEVTAPTVDSVTGTSTTGYTVKGTATPGDFIDVKNTGGTVIGTALVDLNGDYTVVIPVGAATPNEQLSAVARDLLGNQSSPTPFTTPADPVEVTAPTVDTVTGTSSTGYTVTGTATPGNTVEIKNTGGTVVGSTIADGSGNYTVLIPVGLAGANQQLSAVAKDLDGNQSSATLFTTPADPVFVAAPTVDTVTGTSSTGYTVTGTATPSNTVEIKNTGGTVIGTAITDLNGNYTVVIPVGLATPNQQLSAIAKDLLGNQSTATPFITPADPVSVMAPTVDSVSGTSATGYTVTGTATPGNTIEIKNTGGTVIGTAIVDGSGNYTVVIPTGQATPNQQLTAVAKDLDGNQSPATPFTTPADPVVVTAPTVDNVTGTSTTGYTVTGTATVGNTVAIRNTGGTVIGSTIADLNGDYTIDLPIGSATPSQQLAAVAKDLLGNQSTATPFTTPADPVAVTAPTVDNVTGTSSTGYTVTGTATPGNTIEVKNTGGTVIGSAIADGNGDYTVTIPAGSALPSEQLTATAKDADGNTSPATPFTTPADPVVITAPTVDSVTGTSSTGYTVTGTAPADSTVEVRNTGGTVIGSATADANGDYTITIPTGAASASEQLTATAKDADGNTSPATPFTTPADAVEVTAPTVDSVTGTSSTGYTVTGTATPGNTVEVKNTGGMVIGSGLADGSGNYTVTLPTGSAVPNEQLTAVAKDGSGNQSPATPFTTPADPVEVVAPTVDSVTGDSSTGYTVTGTAPAGSTVEITNAGGTVIGSATADENGNYTVTIPAGSATPNEQLTATAKDEDGNSSPGTTFTTPADPVVVAAPTVDSVTGTSSTGYTVTGTAPAGSTVEIKNSGGTVIGSATADENGDYTVTIPAGSATPNEQLTATAKDADGNTSPGTTFTTPADPVNVLAPSVDTVTGSSTSGYTVTGKATAGNTVEIRNTNGTVLGTDVADSNGDYTIVLPVGAASAREQLSAVAKDGAGNTSSATSFTTPADPKINIAPPIILDVEGTSLTGYTVFGKTTFGNKVEIYNADGDLLGQAVADGELPTATNARAAAAEGSFTITIPMGMASPNEQLTSIAKDNANNESVPTLFELPADPGASVSAPIVNNVTGSSTTGYTVTGTADPGNTVNLYSDEGMLVGAGQVDENGNYTIAIPKGMVSPRETDTAVAFDEDGNQSLPTEFLIPADPGSGNGNGNGNGNNNNGNGNGTGNNGLSNNGSGLKTLSSGSRKDLPNNGEIVNNWGLVGALLLGTLGIFGLNRRNKKEEE
ncbi:MULTISPECIES: Ig-like domain-containing protein [unclassified Enterococcus]|uniref:Ig-like domain-containing protein n=1 Tax=unclassified Enterococcus TaxID=2608891 RepID=UPI001CE0C30B|nr:MULTISPECIES: Ig-like domain-containing protein [unclassified Enterococcus]MCA5012818.1 cell wall surface anchor protein [Enterococcus sp. S23]MCA5016069.1 cell wall surface anchor protein [Enterococcus sp. S22(2020)]